MLIIDFYYLIFFDYNSYLFFLIDLNYIQILIIYAPLRFSITQNYYLKLYDNLEIFSDYSVEKFYELSKTESNKIGHLKNTLCT